MFIVRTKVGLFLAKTDSYEHALTILQFWNLYDITCYVWQNGQIVRDDPNW